MPAEPHNSPNNKVDGANIGPIWGRQDPGGPHVGPRNFAIWVPSLTVHAWVFTEWQICCLLASVYVYTDIDSYLTGAVHDSYPDL